MTKILPSKLDGWTYWLIRQGDDAADARDSQAAEAAR